jgi:hypothetical protein
VREMQQGNETASEIAHASFACPYCHTTARPLVRTKVSVEGWMVFAGLLLFFFPLCWLGLRMKENVRLCRECGRHLGSSRAQSVEGRS